MIRNLLLKSILLLFLIQYFDAKAQTVRIEIRAQGTMNENNCIGDVRDTDCGDCSGGPDPVITTRFYIGAITGAGFNINPGNCGSWQWFNGSNSIFTADVAYGSTIGIQLGGYEDDGGTVTVCLPNDGDCWAYNNPNCGSNGVPITNNCPYSWTGNYNTSIENCSSDGSTNDYNVAWNYRYYFVSGYSGGSINGADATICINTDPSGALTSSSPTQCWVTRNWQQNINGAGWTNVGTGATYDPPVATASGYVQYRCEYGYYVNFSGSLGYAYSNIRTYTVSPLSVLGTIPVGSPIVMCDHAGNFPSACVTGNVGTVDWYWGTGAMATPTNYWSTTACSPTCCFPVNPGTGGANKIGWRVTSGACPTVTSGNIIIDNRNAPAATSLTTSQNNYCANLAPANLTLTANFPFGANTTTNVLSNSGTTIEFYSGNCGPPGTLLGTFTPTGVSPSSGTLTITAPTTTTTYFARAVSSCETGACASVTVNVTPAPTFGTVANGDETLCVGGDPNNITLSTAPTGGAGTYNYQWYRIAGVGAACPTGTSTAGWTSVASGASYDPPAGILTSTTYAVTVDPTGTPDCAPATWAASCRKLTVIPQPVLPTLGTATPTNGTSICQGQVTNAVINAGSGGSGATDTYEYSINGGGAWAPYSSGTNIITTTATTSVQIRVSRSAGTALGCNAVGPTVIATWPVYPQPVAPVLNVATPVNGTTICQGENVSATITPGSGGTGAADTYEYSINGGGAWNPYSSGTNIVTTTATTSVQIRVRRSAGTGTGCNAIANTVIVTWPVDLPPTAAASSLLYTCDATANLTATGITSGATIGWQYVSGPVNPTGTSTANPLLITYTSAGTAVYNLLVSKGACNNINVATVNLVMPTVSGVNIASTASCGYCVITDGNTRTFYNSSGQIIGKIEDDGLITPAQLSQTEMCTRINGSVQTVTDNLLNQQPYLQRQWTITPANNTNAKITLYFTNAELLALQAAANSTVYQFSGYDLWITKYPGGTNGVFTSPATLNGVNVPAVFSAYGSNHKVEFEVSSYSTFYIHPSLFPFAALPVELTSFTGWNQGAVNQLNWITASEKNTQKFEVEKRTSVASWTTVGEKAAAGNSNRALSYDFSDNNPVLGNNYYRLKIIDFDGTFSYSNIVNIAIDEVVVNSFVNVYPNPTNRELNVEIQATSIYETKVAAYDVLGKKVFDKTVTVSKGLNKLQLDVAAFAKGTYVLQFADTTGKIHTTKFVKE